ncbi:MAG: hypothetical protein ACREOU_00285 [Candidatus Eiseniibacteriota bacterium]
MRAIRGAAAAVAVALLTVMGCTRERDMNEQVEMPDSMSAMRAMHESTARDSMLDTIPGGEMARGDSAASMRLLKRKM